MKFETLKKCHLKMYLMIGMILICLLIILILNYTKAKYKTTQSIPLVNGTINYSLADFNSVAIYIQSDNGYIQTDEIPKSGFVLNEKESYCKVNDARDDSINLSYDTETKSLSVTPMTTKGTECYLYFEKETAKDVLLANYPTILTRDDFTITVSNTTTGAIYKSKDSSQYDDYGEVYYFAGNPTDNWVKFAGFYWRIIRINGDGSIRMIYQGTSANATGTGTQTTTSAFNSNYNNNMYVGYMYTSGQVHGLGTSSTIKGVLDNWYSSNLSSYASKIDSNAGFCGDREPSTTETTSNGGGGIGTTTTYYGAYIRLDTNRQPSFKCSNNSDLYTTNGSSKGNKVLTYPIGLITADEVAYAGGERITNNKLYYLYTGEYYWTLSPSRYTTNNALMYYVYPNGNLRNDGYTTWDELGVRPVINLKADVTITGGNGSSSNPFTIS